MTRKVLLPGMQLQILPPLRIRSQSLLQALIALKQVGTRISAPTILRTLRLANPYSLFMDGWLNVFSRISARVMERPPKLILPRGNCIILYYIHLPEIFNSEM